MLTAEAAAAAAAAALVFEAPSWLGAPPPPVLAMVQSRLHAWLLTTSADSSSD
jgi:hypothetical protein